MTGYFLAADILGFRNIVRNSGDDLSARISTWTALVTETADRFGIQKRQLISDTLFAACDSDDGAFLLLLQFAKSLLEQGIRASLPVRGAISHGDFHWGELTYGNAVLKCHEWEQKQEWVGIACVPGTPVPPDAFSTDLVTVYPPPCKRGPIVLTCVLVWDIPDLSELSRLLCGGGLAGQKEVMYHEWLTKVQNTILFKHYRKLVSDIGAPNSKFYGASPLEIIGLHLKGNRLRVSTTESIEHSGPADAEPPSVAWAPFGGPAQKN